MSKLKVRLSTPTVNYKELNKIKVFTFLKGNINEKTLLNLAIDNDNSDAINLLIEAGYDFLNDDGFTQYDDVEKKIIIKYFQADFRFLKILPNFLIYYLLRIENFFFRNYNKRVTL